MADNAPVATDPMDAGLEAATDMLNWSDAEIQKHMNLPTLTEPDGEPAADAILPPAEPAAPAAQQPPAAPPAEQPKPEAAKPAEPPADPAKPPEAPRQPIAEFTVADVDGAELEVSPDISVTYTANGKEVTRPFDKVVRLAQMGEYNAEREEQVQQSKQLVQTYQQEIQQRDTRLQEYESFYERILSDPDFRSRAVAEYVEANTPEAKLARMEAQLEARNTREQEATEAQQAAAFVATHVTPRVTQLVDGNPLVPFEEVMGQFNMLIAPLLVRGRVETRSLPTVKQLVDTDLAHWVQQRQMARETSQQRVTNQVEAAKTQTTLAKRQLARAQQPAPAVDKVTTKPKEFESAEDWFESTLPAPQSS